MDILCLFFVAAMPIIQALLIGIIGAYLASGYSGILTAIARKDMNKVVFHIFTPALMFVSLARTVTVEDVFSWWFMPVNIAIVYIVGGILGWFCKGFELAPISPTCHGCILFSSLLMPIATQATPALGLLRVLVPSEKAMRSRSSGNRNIMPSSSCQYFNTFTIRIITFLTISRHCVPSSYPDKMHKKANKSD